MRLPSWLRRLLPPERTPAIVNRFLTGPTVIDATPLHHWLLLQMASGPAVLANLEQICSVPPRAKVIVRYFENEWMIASNLEIARFQRQKMFGGVVTPRLKSSWEVAYLMWDGDTGVFDGFRVSPSPPDLELETTIALLLLIFAFCHTPRGVAALAKSETPLRETRLPEGAVAYHVLEIGGPDTPCLPADPEREAARQAPMLHWVRRHRRSGKVIPQHLRGDIERGLMFKDYRTRKQA